MICDLSLNYTVIEVFVDQLFALREIALVIKYNCLPF